MGISDIAPEHYQGLRGHLRLSWLKVTSMAKIQGGAKSLASLWRNLLSAQLQFRLEGTLTHLLETFKCGDGVTFDRIATVDGLHRWEFLPDLRRLRGTYGLAQAQLRLSRGYLLVCAYLNKSLAGFVWLAPASSKEAGYELNPNEVYYHDAWTFREFRGMGVFPSLIVYSARTIQETNPKVDTLVAHAVRSNKAAVSGQKKAGMKITALEISVFMFGVFRRYRLKTYNNSID